MAGSRTAVVEPTGSLPERVAQPFGISVLGELSVRAGDRDVAIRRGLPRIVLSSLVIDRGRPVAANTLIDRLWGDRLPNHPANALQTQVAYLRRVLGGAGAAPILTGPTGYRLDGADVDVDAFEACVADGRRRRGDRNDAELRSALTAYDTAFAMWRGSPYGEIAGFDFADAEIIRLEELYAVAQEERCEILLDLGRVAEAVVELSAMVNAHPLREQRQRLLVLALYRSGRQADALRAYERARRALADELGVSPGDALRLIEGQVLDHDPALDWIPPDVAASPRGAVGGASPYAPSGPGPIIGRDRELARVAELVAERRLVTLTGPGGAGKTRLASEFAASCGRQTYRVDLGGIDEVDRVGPMIAAAAGVTVMADSDPVDAVVDGFGDDGVLLVLDTCEHVLDGVVSVLSRLLPACPGLRVLATSRRPLGLHDELAWPIPPLAVPTAGVDPHDTPAFQLFVARARSVVPDFGVDPANVTEIADLCRALDGLPLAIELAAAQMDVLTPGAVRAQLSERRPLVNRAGGPDRHRTLDATTAWSVGLLADDERDMLYRLAVFAPTFDLDAAIAVAGDGAEATVDRFVTLVRSSLVVHSHDDRYRLLDTVRSYLVTSEPDDARRDRTRRRHGEYYAALAARAFHQVRGPHQARWLRRLHDDRPNLRIALRWCFGPDGDDQVGARFAGDIAWVWTLQGNMLDSGTALDRALRVDAGPLVRARLLLGIGLLAGPLGDQARVIEVCTESAELGRSVGDDETIAVAQLTLGVAQWATGDLELAAATHDEAIERFDETGDVWSRTVCRVLRARTARDAGDPELAQRLLEASIDDAKSTGDDHVVGIAFEQYARLWLELGELDRAARAAGISLRHNETLDYAEGVAAALAVSAEIELRRSEVDRARELAERAIGVAAGLGHVGAMCAGVEVMAAVEAATGDSSTAARYLLTSDRARGRHGLPLAPDARQRVGRELDRFRHELGDAWSGLVAEVPMTSLAELARSIVGDG